MYKATLLLWCLLICLSACETQAQRKAQQSQTLTKQAGQEIDRICSLPEAERAAELQRIKDQSGMVLYCGNR